MARRTISIDEKIEAARETVEKTKAKYDVALAELRALEAKRDKEKQKEVLDAIAKSGKSLDEILKFVQE